MNKPHRLFFALWPDNTVRKQAESLQRSLETNGRPARPHQFHVTLAFLGMQAPELIPEILGVASRLEFESCRVVLDRLGRFRRAGVLWLGTSEPPPALVRFQHRLVGALLDAGIGYDRKPWKFHLTLYRKMRTAPPIMDSVAIEWPLNGFSLIESVGVKNGVVYHEIGHWKAGSGG
jgi:2'-5' RNA ligase